MLRLARITGLGLGFILLLSVALAIIQTMRSDDAITFTMGWEYESTRLFPISVHLSAALLTQLYQRDVFDYNNNLEPYPVMITEIPSLANGRVTQTDNGATQVRYTLRDGLRWSDGEPITTQDCLFGHRLFTADSGVFSTELYRDLVEQFEVIDSQSFRITYHAPNPDYLSVGAPTCGLPAHILEPYLDQYGSIDDAPYFGGEGVVGYGPYILSAWNKDENMIFERNPYWGENGYEHRPTIDRIVMKIIPDGVDIRRVLDSDEIDMVPGYSIDLFETFDNMEDITAFTTSGALQDAVWINMYQNGDQNPALKDVRVRQAIAHAINREKMIRETLGVALPVPRSWYNERYIPDDVQILAYDPQQARNLLDEANWIDTDGDGIRDDGNGTPLSLRFYTTTDPVRVDFQKYIAADLEQVGIGVEAFPVPSSILFAPFDEDGILMTGNFDLVLFGLTHDMVSPNTGLYWFGCDSIQNPDGGNGYGFCDPRWDELQSKLIPVETDPDVRVELVHEAVRRMDSAVFWIGVYPRTSNYALNTKRWNIDSFQNMGILSGNAFNTVEYWEPN